MNKFFLHIISLLVLLLPTKAFAQTLCLFQEDTKVIGISNESNFEVKEDCNTNEIEIEYKELPNLIFKDSVISNITIRKASIEEAIELLKRSKRKLEKTEDLIKLIDFLPTAMPLQISIVEFMLTTASINLEPIQLDFDFSRMSDYDFFMNTKIVGIVLIDSQNIVVDEIKNHKVIALPNI